MFTSGVRVLKVNQINNALSTGGARTALREGKVVHSATTAAESCSQAEHRRRGPGAKTSAVEAEATARRDQHHRPERAGVGPVALSSSHPLLRRTRALKNQR